MGWLPEKQKVYYRWPPCRINREINQLNFKWTNHWNNLTKLMGASFSTAIPFTSSWSPVNPPHRSQWRGALGFSLSFAWTNGWASHRHAGDLRRHRAHYDVIVMPPHFMVTHPAMMDAWWPPYVLITLIKLCLIMFEHVADNVQAFIIYMGSGGRIHDILKHTFTGQCQSECSVFANIWIEEYCARSRYQEQGQVITPHSICVM